MARDYDRDPELLKEQRGSAFSDDCNAGLEPFCGYSSLIIRISSDKKEVIRKPEQFWSIEVEHIQSGGHWVFSTIEALEDLLRILFEHLKKIQQNQESRQP